MSTESLPSGETPYRHVSTTVGPTSGEQRVRIPSGPEESAEQFIARLRGFAGMRPSEPPQRSVFDTEAEAAERHSHRLHP